MLYQNTFELKQALFENYVRFIMKFSVTKPALLNFTVLSINFLEWLFQVISTRKVQTEDGTLFLDMKCGNLMQQRITR